MMTCRRWSAFDRKGMLTIGPAWLTYQNITIELEASIQSLNNTSQAGAGEHMLYSVRSRFFTAQYTWSLNTSV